MRIPQCQIDTRLLCFLRCEILPQMAVEAEAGQKIYVDNIS